MFSLNVKNIQKQNKGFTLIELILYIAILTIMMNALIPFAWNIIQAGAKSSTEQEVFSTARYVSERIKYEIRNASGINSVSANSISLTELVAANNPTVIDLSANQVRIKLGASSPVVLNSTNTKVTDLTFTNYTSSDNKTKNIDFTLTVTGNYSSAGQEYTDSTSLRASAEVRSN